MAKRLVQLLGDGIEELWYFPEDVTDEQIQKIYKDWENNDDYDSFEEYLEEYIPQMDAERVFVDEIYV